MPSYCSGACSERHFSTGPETVTFGGERVSVAVLGVALRSAWRLIANQGQSFSDSRLSLASEKFFCMVCQCVTMVWVVAHFPAAGR